ncbi:MULTISPECIES: hypothetical protein [Azorhizobium]|jgi:hypothetical protein|uniref:Uncharacterized protein n=1 Tax=Azorhizobium caulinodans (strain ATCC 43989 / DSM 5975 / JCM 20966 / LMG 6465 / NBRC 14845 / NCIMB 13405 / ORS 571) TaxID=438753 RepID=A8HVX5_AZOC5|nr:MULTISPECIES: hypothetical protein [Azorhizobium]TDT89542.1 hypothetical protein DFO45_4463 [Azorhizobium sp. AG788]BAF90367.1 unknown protein [Azorhizobium caulinodans ORS 571]
MSRNALYAIIAVLVVGGGVFAYQAYQAHEEKERSLQIQVGPNGVKVDPPSR